MSTNRIRTLGLALVAVFALGAVVVSAAEAGEYGQCVKLTEKTGGYTNEGCTTKSATKKGEFEWKAGASAHPNYTSTTGVAKLVSAAGTVECKKSTDKGKVTGVKTDTDTVTFEECKSEGVSCQKSGTVEKPAPAGIIVTNLLDTELIDHGEKGRSGLEPKEGEVWTQFVSSEHEPYQAEFECGGAGTGRGILFRVKGSLSAVTTVVNKMETTFTLKFAEKKGEQDLELEKSTNGGTSWTTAIPSEEITEATVTNEETAPGVFEKTEIKAI
jgi:hypothetical protein